MRKGLIVSALLAYVAWQIWLSVAAPAKISPDLAKAEAEKVNVLVTLPFPPERFHVLVFQRYGRVSGTHENSVELRGVPAKNLRAVARPYWVRKVEPLGGGQS